jgi:uncharacterized 2Fe-2S/4Fe-4S cluster protein (DUF4445 family)
VPSASPHQEGLSSVNQTDSADCQVTFQPIGKRVSVKAGSTLLDAGRDAGFLLSANCGGVGLCGRCRVSVVSGDMYPPEENEQAYLESSGHASGERLACEARIAGHVVVDVPPGSFDQGQRLQLSGIAGTVPCDPMVESHDLNAEPPSLNDSRSDFRRIADALASQTGRAAWTMQPRTASQLACMARELDWTLRAYCRGDEVIGFARTTRSALGLAVDVGCTKIAAYLLDLQSGEQLAAEGVANPQLPYGEDLITRLVFAAKAEAQSLVLASLVRGAIRDLATNLCGKANAVVSEIGDVCMVGNTAMMHLLLGLPVEQLLHAPFISSMDSEIGIAAHDLGLEFAPGAQVHILPSIGGFVGADHVAMILAHGIERSAKVTIGIDIGTNTEIVVHDPRTGSLFTTSVPSGPAFEGGHVSDGMRAASGAIEKVFSVSGRLQYQTIDGVAPAGICGSGVVDLIAEMWRLKYIDERGHLLMRDERVSVGKKGLEFLVVPAKESGHGRDIVLTQQDITAVQLAKAAISAGIASLLEISATPAEAVEQVVIAGAFGSYLDLRSAIAVGLLPRLPNAEYLQIGNAAGAGAKMALVSRAERERARSIAKRATRIELEQHKNFARLLARATRFPV